MSLPLRTRAIPQCSGCLLRSCAWADAAAAAPSPQSQIRGKKKMARPTGNVPARLLKDLPGFGKKGSIVPMARGIMRNNHFPSRTAEYVTMPELRSLRAQNMPIERDYMFGKRDSAPSTDGPALFSAPEAVEEVYTRKGPEVEKLTGERSIELLEIFVPHRMDFFRQPIIEEPPEQKPVEEPKKKEQQKSASSAAADLLAARTQKPLERPQPKMTGAIYGSVSQHDVLLAVRAAMATNDEAARVIVSEQDVVFVDEKVRAENKIKEVGDFEVDISVRGEESGIKRVVRVVPQEV